jgi:hypothetical protein
LCYCFFVVVGFEFEVYGVEWFLMFFEFVFELVGSHFDYDFGRVFGVGVVFGFVQGSEA